MVKIIFLLLSSIEGGKVCSERTCSFCSRITQQNAISSPKQLVFCEMLLRIENCCIRFYGSMNTLGPLENKDETENDDNMKSRYILYFTIIGGIVICLIMRAIQKRNEVRTGATLVLAVLSISTLFPNQKLTPSQNKTVT